MLKQRVLTAIILLLALAGALAAGPVPTALALALVVCAACFEWLQLAGHRRPLALAMAIVFSALLLGFEFWLPRRAPAALTMLTAAACAVWLTLVPILMHAQTRGIRMSRLNSSLLCIGLLGVAWCSLMHLYRLGVGLLLSVLALVWIADIAAYFVGRALGRHKLAPQISPGKTWEGVYGALFGVLLAALVVVVTPAAADLFPSRLVQSLPWVVVLLALAVLVVLSIVGDLFESLLKRQAGVKDSGTLLPGHGGVLDRIDALLPVLPAAVLLLQFAA